MAQSRQANIIVISGMAIAALFVALLTAGPVQAGSSSESDRIGQPVSSSLMKELDRISHESLKQKEDVSDNNLQAIDGPGIASGNKAGILYMGADYCPYCASIRWPLVLALLRFGHFNHLHYMRSSANDVFANTATFSFHDTEYHSKYLEFQSVELQDREQNRLEAPDPKQIKVFRKFDNRPYTTQPGSIPFLYISGRFIQSGAPFSPGLLADSSWRAATGKLKNPKTKLSQRVIGITNLYTAALCQRTDGHPHQVCHAPGVKAAAEDLPSHSSN